MKFTSYSSFSADLASKGLEYAVKRSARLGFESVEFLSSYPAREPLPRRYSAAEVRRLLDGHGLRVACYSIYADLFRGSDEEFLAAMREHVSFAAAIGSPLLHHTLAPHVPAEGDTSYAGVLAAIAPRIESVIAMAKEAGIVCLYEPQGPYFNGVDGLGRLLERLLPSYENVAVCGDVGNSLFVDCDPVDVYRAFADRILHVHVKDYLRYDERVEGAAGQSRGGKWLLDCRIGEGIVDLATCFRLLKATGYDGRFALEMSGDDEEIRRMMAYIRDVFERA